MKNPKELPEYKALIKITKDVTFAPAGKRGSFKFQDKRYPNVFYSVANTKAFNMTANWSLLRKDGSSTQLDFDYVMTYKAAFKLILKFYKRTELRIAIRTLKGLL